jgi:hypothetical protein
MAEVEWYRFVHKHQHLGAKQGEWCEVPWSAICQSEHVVETDADGFRTFDSRICYGSDHPTHALALAAIGRHIEAGTCDPDRDLPYTGHVTEETSDD